MRLAATAVVLSFLVLGASVPAHAQVAHLNWNDCSNGGVKLRSFACNTNSGSNALVASVQAANNAPIEDLRGFTARITVFSIDAALPPWWQIHGAGNCRPSLTMDFSAPEGGGCMEYWYGYAAGGITGYQVGFGGANRARISMVGSMDPAWAFTINPSEEIYLFQLHINNLRTVGTCDGCLAGAGLEFTDLRLDLQSQGFLGLVPSNGDQYASWQCPLIYGTPEPHLDCTTPVTPDTWGSIKALYR